jgi:Haem-binding domain
MAQQRINSGPPGRAKKWLVRIAAGCAFLGVAIQFVPVTGTENPKSQPPLPEKPEVVAILKRACYDCHSHEVKWVWYTRVAPASWLVARDVIEGRKGINFSEWPEDDDDRQFNREAVWESVEDGSMPLWFYTPLHPEAVLTDADKAILKAWAEAPEEEEEEEEGDEKDGADKDEKAGDEGDKAAAGGTGAAKAEAAGDEEE